MTAGLSESSGSITAIAMAPSASGPASWNVWGSPSALWPLNCGFQPRLLISRMTSAASFGMPRKTTCSTPAALACATTPLKLVVPRSNGSLTSGTLALAETLLEAGDRILAEIVVLIDRRDLGLLELIEDVVGEHKHLHPHLGQGREDVAMHAASSANALNA